MWMINLQSDCKKRDQYQLLSKSLAHQWFYEQIKVVEKNQSFHILSALILTHNLIQLSLDMTIYKLSLQQESIGLHSPSINDSLITPTKIQKNNFAQIYKTLDLLEITQQKLEAMYIKMRIVGSCIISLPTSITQAFINNVKKVLVAWSCNQKKNLEQFFQKIKSISILDEKHPIIFSHYKEMTSSTFLDHQAIKSFASSLSKEYHDLEYVFTSLLFLNKKRAEHLKKVFTLTFKDHFTILYAKLSPEDRKLFFAEIDNLELSAIAMDFIS
jgi:hypothetical protein